MFYPTNFIMKYQHKQDKHRDIIEEERAAKNKYVDIDPKTRKMIHNEKLKEVENLLVKVTRDLWKCKIWGKAPQFHLICKKSLFYC